MTAAGIALQLGGGDHAGLAGILLLHASTGVLQDKAGLIGGTPDAVKSTLAAELLGAGVRLLVDDLTAFSLGPKPLAWRGRPAMRLHPDTFSGVS